MSELLTKKKKQTMDRERKLMDLVVRALMRRRDESVVTITVDELNAVMKRPTFYLLKDDFSIEVTMEDEHVNRQ